LEAAGKIRAKEYGRPRRLPAGKSSGRLAG
jgi:hypothetical protein